MNKELKKAIIAYMIENEKDFQLVNRTTNEFKQYIFLPSGEYCIGGETVYQFIISFHNLIKE